MENETTPETPTGAPFDTPAEQPAKKKLKDRAWGWRSLAATAVAALLIGGAVGTGITVLVSDDNSDHQQRRGQFGPPGDGERPDFPEGEFPGGQDGERPDATEGSTTVWS